MRENILNFPLGSLSNLDSCGTGADVAEANILLSTSSSFPLMSPEISGGLSAIQDSSVFPETCSCCSNGIVVGLLKVVLGARIG
jgi:hypothetical protein